MPAEQPARRAGRRASRSRRTGSGPGASTTACARSARAERALEMMCQRANDARRRSAGRSAEKQFVQEFDRDLADGDRPGAAARRCYAAWKMDTEGKRAARQDDLDDQGRRRQHASWTVLDRAIQVHGALGMTDDTPLAAHVALRPHAAPRRRPRRGPQDGDRPPRAEPLVKRAEAESRGRLGPNAPPDTAIYLASLVSFSHGRNRHA